MIEIKNRVVDAINEINVANDKEVIKLQFKCKNQVTDLIKLSDCTLFINYQNGSLKDRYAVQNLTVNGEDVTFSWTLGRNATAKSGKTYFVICAVKMNGSDIEQEWNSVLTSFDVKKGLETITAPTKEMQDLFAELTEMVEGRLTPDNIKAGQNVTVEIDGNDVTIASTGGGGASYTAGTGIVIDDDEISVDFTDVQGKLTAGSNITISSDTISAIDTKYTAGNGLTLDNNILKALTNAQFVDTLPSANINEEATYYIMDSKVFPDVSSYDTTGEFPVIFVAYNEEAVQNKWVMLRTDFTNFFHWYYKTLEGNNYEVYGLNANQDGWTLLESDTGTGWANYLGVSDGQQQLFMSRIWYANQHLSGGGLDYYTTSNRANVYGVPTDTSQLNPYIQIGYQRKNNEWINLGRSDFTKLFEVLVTTVNGKIDTSAIKQTTGQSTTDLMSQKAVTDELSGKQDTLVNQSNIKSINGASLLGSGDISIPVPLVFSNLSVATTDWVADSTYTDYGYKAVLTCSGVTASMEADVYLSSASASLGVVASFCDEGTDSVTIYSTSNENAITIDKVVAS